MPLPSILLTAPIRCLDLLQVPLHQLYLGCLLVLYRPCQLLELGMLGLLERLLGHIHGHLVVRDHHA